jgi:hypothetical protein
VERDKREGLRVERSRGGDFGQNHHLPPLDTTEQRRGGRSGGGSGSCGRQPSRARRRPGVGERREEVEGNSFLSSPWVGTACGRISVAAGELQADAALVAAVGARGREREVCGSTGRCGVRRRVALAIYRRTRRLLVEVAHVSCMRSSNGGSGRRVRVSQRGQLRHCGGAVRRGSSGSGGLSGDVRDWGNSGGGSEVCGGYGVVRRGSVACARASRARHGVQRRGPGRRARADARGCRCVGDAARGRHGTVPDGSARSPRGPARQLAVVVGLVLKSGACDSSACSSCWLVLE